MTDTYPVKFCFKNKHGVQQKTPSSQASFHAPHGPVQLYLFLADLVTSTPFNILPRHPFSSSYQLRKQLIGDSEVRIEGEKRRRGTLEE